MNSLYILMLRTACNTIQWVLDRNPAPQNDALITEANQRLDEAGKALQAAIDNAGN